MIQTINSVHQLGTALVAELGSLLQEECWILGVTTQMRILVFERVALGTADHVQVHPRDIFRRLVAVNAYGFIIVRNHPSGSLHFSTADEEFKLQLVLCSKLMQCHLLDFMVVAQTGYLSQRAVGRLPEISLQEFFKSFTN